METPDESQSPRLAEASGAPSDAPAHVQPNHESQYSELLGRFPQKGRWIPKEDLERVPTVEEIEASEKMMDEIAARMEGLPPDFARNRRLYRSGLLRE